MFYVFTVGIYMVMRAYFTTTTLIIPVGIGIKLFTLLATCYGGL